MAVDWLDLVQMDSVKLQKHFSSKVEILEFLAEQMSQSPKLKNCTREEILQTLQKREDKSSTGLGGGIAAPHCGLSNAEGFVIMILTLAEPIDFGSFDSMPCNFIIAIVGPEKERNQHVQILASLASGLQKENEVQALLSCSNLGEAMQILGRIFAVDFSGPKEALPENLSKGKFWQTKEKYSRVTIIVQREKFFVPLLEEAMRASAGAVTVIEGHNVTEFLLRMPLYAYMLSSQRLNKFLRCIEAVVPNSELNAIYEMAKIIDKKVPEEAGLLVFHQEIHGMLGALDY